MQTSFFLDYQLKKCKPSFVTEPSNDVLVIWPLWADEATEIEIETETETETEMQ